MMDIIPILKPGIWNAWIFMSVFILQMLVITIAGDRVRKRSHLPGEAKRSKIDRYTGMTANSVWFLALLYSIFLPFKPGTVWFYSGLFVFVLGLTLLTLATRNFISTPSDQLITKGAYSFSRHPMYNATFLICLGSGISTGSWIFICISFIMAYCFHREALAEEKYCLNIYGNAYQEYMDRVPRWIGVPGRIN
jgi:protein-S-isoprenylcysteine O-methyltransferase Ste14